MRPIEPLRRLAALLLALPLLAAPGRAAAAQERDEWQLIHLDDAKIGFIHVVVEKADAGGKPGWRTTTDNSMTLNRLGTSVSVISSSSTVEDEAGGIVEVVSETNMSSSKTLVHARVEGDQAEVTRRIAGPPQVQTMDWKKEWLGDVAIDRITRAKIKAGEKQWSLESWSAEAGAMVTTSQVLGKQKVDVPGIGERELLQLRTTIDVQPGMINDTYVDETGDTVMAVTKIMNMRMISVRSNKAACLAAFANPDTPEVFNKLSPRTNVRLPDPYHTDEIVLDLKATDPEVPLPKLEDERQTIVERKGADEVVLRVVRVVPDRKFTLPLSGFTLEEQECLEPNLHIESADPELVALAKQAIGAETDAWAAACALEKFACGYISNKSMSSLFETAASVMKSRAGDCTEHGVFLAALCRAVGIPARVAVGLLYFQGIWGGHMWAEVSLGGKWYALDAVLGHGGVDAGHLRLAANSLKSTEIDRVFANVSLGMSMKMDLLSYRHGDKEVKIGADTKVCEVDGRRYRHLLYGVSLTAPEGYAIEPNEKISLGDNEIVELDREGGPDIDVEVMDVSHDFALDDVKEILAGRGVSRVKATDRAIDGRAGKLFRGKKSKTECAIAAVLREETLILVGCRIADGENDEALQAVLDSLDLDG